MIISRAVVGALVLGGTLALSGCPASDDSDTSDTVMTTLPATTASATDMTMTDPTVMTTSMSMTMGDGSSTGPSVDCTDAPTHEVDMQPIWNNSCTQDMLGGCHEPMGTWEFLDMSPGVAYDAIVENVAVHTQSTGVFLVEPNSKENSYLWHKIVGTPTEVPGGCCEPMPNMNEMLPADQIDLIGLWIDCGALP